MPDFLHDGPEIPRAHVLLAHGSNAPMDHPFMTEIAHRIGNLGIKVSRFEFAYMAGRRTGGTKRPPPRADRLLEEYRTALELITPKTPLYIGGKSLGGRVASMLADELYRSGKIAGLICLGYPFHPTGKPENLRTAHLSGIICPALICQGERDPMGNLLETQCYDLSPAIEFHWLTDGDHSWSPRKRSGVTLDDNLQTAVDALDRFVSRPSA